MIPILRDHYSLVEHQSVVGLFLVALRSISELWWYYVTPLYAGELLLLQLL